MRQHFYQCLGKGCLLPFAVKSWRKWWLCTPSMSILHLQNARNGRGWEVGRMHQVLEMVPHRQMSEHFSRILRRWLGLPWLFILGTFHPFPYHAFHFYPCMHYLTFHLFLYHALIFIHALVCLLLVRNSCTFGTLALSYSCTITVCLIHSLTNMYGVLFVSKLLGFF